jgi:hypothetical protein
VTTAAPYCPDAQCIEDECSPDDPCCSAVCGFNCPTAECFVWDAGRQVYSDGTFDDLVWCGEHKNEVIKQ